MVMFLADQQQLLIKQFLEIEDAFLYALWSQSGAWADQESEFRKFSSERNATIQINVETPVVKSLVIKKFEGQFKNLSGEFKFAVKDRYGNVNAQKTEQAVQEFIEQISFPDDEEYTRALVIEQKSSSEGIKLTLKNASLNLNKAQSVILSSGEILTGELAGKIIGARAISDPKDIASVTYVAVTEGDLEFNIDFLKHNLGFRLREAIAQDLIEILQQNDLNAYESYIDMWISAAETSLYSKKRSIFAMDIQEIFRDNSCKLTEHQKKRLQDIVRHSSSTNQELYFNYIYFIKEYQNLGDNIDVQETALREQQGIERGSQEYKAYVSKMYDGLKRNIVSIFEKNGESIPVGEPNEIDQAVIELARFSAQQQQLALANSSAHILLTTIYAVTGLDYLRAADRKLAELRDEINIETSFRNPQLAVQSYAYMRHSMHQVKKYAGNKIEYLQENRTRALKGLAEQIDILHTQKYSNPNEKYSVSFIRWFLFLQKVLKDNITGKSDLSQQWSFLDWLTIARQCENTFARSLLIYILKDCTNSLSAEAKGNLQGIIRASGLTNATSPRFFDQIEQLLKNFTEVEVSPQQDELFSIKHSLNLIFDNKYYANGDATASTRDIGGEIITGWADGKYIGLSSNNTVPVPVLSEAVFTAHYLNSCAKFKKEYPDFIKKFVSNLIVERSRKKQFIKEILPIIEDQALFLENLLKQISNENYKFNEFLSLNQINNLSANYSQIIDEITHYICNELNSLFDVSNKEKIRERPEELIRIINYLSEKFSSHHKCEIRTILIKGLFSTVEGEARNSAFRTISSGIKDAEIIDIRNPLFISMADNISGALRRNAHAAGKNVAIIPDQAINSLQIENELQAFSSIIKIFYPDIKNITKEVKAFQTELYSSGVRTHAVGDMLTLGLLKLVDNIVPVSMHPAAGGEYFTEQQNNNEKTKVFFVNKAFQLDIFIAWIFSSECLIGKCIIGNIEQDSASTTDLRQARTGQLNSIVSETLNPIYFENLAPVGLAMLKNSKLAKRLFSNKETHIALLQKLTDLTLIEQESNKTNTNNIFNFLFKYHEDKKPHFLHLIENATLADANKILKILKNSSTAKYWKDKPEFIEAIFNYVSRITENGKTPDFSIIETLLQIPEVILIFAKANTAKNTNITSQLAELNKRAIDHLSLRFENIYLAVFSEFTPEQFIDIEMGGKVSNNPAFAHLQSLQEKINHLVLKVLMPAPTTDIRILRVSQLVMVAYKAYQQGNDVLAHALYSALNELSIMRLWSEVDLQNKPERYYVPNNIKSMLGNLTLHFENDYAGNIGKKKSDAFYLASPVVLPQNPHKIKKSKLVAVKKEYIKLKKQWEHIAHSCRSPNDLLDWEVFQTNPENSDVQVNAITTWVDSVIALPGMSGDKYGKEAAKDIREAIPRTGAPEPSIGANKYINECASYLISFEPESKVVENYEHRQKQFSEDFQQLAVAECLAEYAATLNTKKLREILDYEEGVQFIIDVSKGQENSSNEICKNFLKNIIGLIGRQHIPYSIDDAQQKLLIQLKYYLACRQVSEIPLKELTNDEKEVIALILNTSGFTEDSAEYSIVNNFLVTNKSALLYLMHFIHQPTRKLFFEKINNLLQEENPEYKAILEKFPMDAFLKIIIFPDDNNQRSRYIELKEELSKEGKRLGTRNKFIADSIKHCEELLISVISRPNDWVQIQREISENLQTFSTYESAVFYHADREATISVLHKKVDQANNSLLFAYYSQLKDLGLTVPALDANLRNTVIDRFYKDYLHGESSLSEQLCNEVASEIARCWWSLHKNKSEISPNDRLTLSFFHGVRKHFNTITDGVDIETYEEKVNREELLKELIVTNKSGKAKEVVKLYYSYLKLVSTSTIGLSSIRFLAQHVDNVSLLIFNKKEADKITISLQDSVAVGDKKAVVAIAEESSTRISSVTLEEADKDALLKEVEHGEKLSKVEHEEKLRDKACKDEILNKTEFKVWLDKQYSESGIFDKLDKLNKNISPVYRALGMLFEEIGKLSKDSLDIEGIRQKYYEFYAVRREYKPGSTIAANVYIAEEEIKPSTAQKIMDCLNLLEGVIFILNSSKTEENAEAINNQIVNAVNTFKQYAYRLYLLRNPEDAANITANDIFADYFTELTTIVQPYIKSSSTEADKEIALAMDLARRLYSAELLATPESRKESKLGNIYDARKRHLLPIESKYWHASNEELATKLKDSPGYADYFASHGQWLENAYIANGHKLLRRSVGAAPSFSEDVKSSITKPTFALYHADAEKFRKLRALKDVTLALHELIKYKPLAEEDQRKLEDIAEKLEIIPAKHSASGKTIRGVLKAVNLHTFVFGYHVTQLSPDELHGIARQVAEIADKLKERMRADVEVNIADDTLANQLMKAANIIAAAQKEILGISEPAQGENATNIILSSNNNSIEILNNLDEEYNQLLQKYKKIIDIDPEPFTDLGKALIQLQEQKTENGVYNIKAAQLIVDINNIIPAPEDENNIKKFMVSLYAKLIEWNKQLEPALIAIFADRAIASVAASTVLDDLKTTLDAFKASLRQCAASNDKINLSSATKNLIALQRQVYPLWAKIIAQKLSITKLKVYDAESLTPAELCEMLQSLQGIEKTVSKEKLAEILKSLQEKLASIEKFYATAAANANSNNLFNPDLPGLSPKIDRKELKDIQYGVKTEISKLENFAFLTGNLEEIEKETGILKIRCNDLLQGIRENVAGDLHNNLVKDDKYNFLEKTAEHKLKWQAAQGEVSSKENDDALIKLINATTTSIENDIEAYVNKLQEEHNTWKTVLNEAYTSIHNNVVYKFLNWAGFAGYQSKLRVYEKTLNSLSAKTATLADVNNLIKQKTAIEADVFGSGWSVKINNVKEKITLLQKLYNKYPKLYQYSNDNFEGIILKLINKQLLQAQNNIDILSDAKKQTQWNEVYKQATDTIQQIENNFKTVLIDWRRQLLYSIDNALYRYNIEDPEALRKSSNDITALANLEQSNNLVDVEKLIEALTAAEVLYNDNIPDYAREEQRSILPTGQLFEEANSPRAEEATSSESRRPQSQGPSFFSWGQKSNRTSSNASENTPLLSPSETKASNLQARRTTFYGLATSSSMRQLYDNDAFKIMLSEIGRELPDILPESNLREIYRSLVARKESREDIKAILTSMIEGATGNSTSTSMPQYFSFSSVSGGVKAEMEDFRKQKVDVLFSAPITVYATVFYYCTEFFREIKFTSPLSILELNSCFDMNEALIKLAQQHEANPSRHTVQTQLEALDTLFSVAFKEQTSARDDYVASVIYGHWEALWQINQQLPEGKRARMAGYRELWSAANTDLLVPDYYDIPEKLVSNGIKICQNANFLGSDKPGPRQSRIFIH